MDWSFLARQHRQFIVGTGLQLPEPCMALPGTEEKMDVLRDRKSVIRRKGTVAKPEQLLFHPDDATWELFWRLRAEPENPKSRWRAPHVVMIDGVSYQWSCSVTPLPGFNPADTQP